jgi:quercetin 2,3-dioxygenase
MANKIIHRAGTRGAADHGWLKAKHSFSFANYYDPQRIHFGVLRVLNDDTVAGGMGFGKHPHDNMEIITIPLEGSIEHKDSMGNQGIIKYGDVQVMSAGTGVQHSEYNASQTDPLKLFQIWLFPNKKNVKPRYDQVTLNVEDRKNKLQEILSPKNDEGRIWIHQDAWFSMGKFDKDFAIDYSIKRKGNGVYLMVVKGNVIVEGEKLGERDAIGLSDTDNISIQAETQDAEVLVMDIPMEFSAN